MTAPLGPWLVIAALLLAVALLVAGGRPGRNRLRELDRRPPRDSGPTPVVRTPWIVVGVLAAGAVGWVAGGPAAGIVAAGAAALLAGLAGRTVAARPAGATGAGGTGAGELAGSWELLAVCLRAGLPVVTALSAATEPVAGPTGRQLRRVAGLLALGADPATAWAGTVEVPALGVFARAAGRSAGTGAALAHVAAAEAERLRAELLDSAQARAQRAAVHITGPLGLCFLPAFLVLGVAPVVIGLAQQAMAQW
jgi:Flp pilus assembly protein TadB